MRQAIGILVLAMACAFAAPGGATSFSTDQSDVWWNPDESGWGAELVQRGSIVVATIYVYGPTGQATWYNAALAPTGASYTWSGDLYAYSGPWFGAVPFSPGAMSHRKVGTMTWYGQYTDAGVLTYSVDGVPVQKNLQRASTNAEDYSGTFKGAIYSTASGCLNPADNGGGDDYATFTVAQNGQSLRLTASFPDGTGFTIDGTVRPSGQFGILNGTYATTLGEVGTITLYEMSVQLHSIAARFVASSTNTGCQSSGYLSGIWRG